MSIEDKIVSREEALIRVQQWQTNGEKVVFTNGCFDILHAGHVLFLEEARSLGDKLVLGLNSDDSVRRLKGEHRPLQTEEARSHILAAMACIDLVVVFEEDTPLALIQNIKPDVLVKGGDYAPNEIVGGLEVLKYGGTVKSLSFHKGYSTTGIEQRIIASYKNRTS